MALMDIGFAESEPGVETGSADALFDLGMRYATGLDVPVDLVVAHKWFNLAAMRGNRAAFGYRKDVAAEMNAAEIAEAQRQARAWLANETLEAGTATGGQPVAAGLRGADRLVAERRAIEIFAAERFGACRDDDDTVGDEPIMTEIEVDEAGRLAA